MKQFIDSILDEYKVGSAAAGQPSMRTAIAKIQKLADEVGAKDGKIQVHVFCGDSLDTQQLLRLQAQLTQYIFNKTVFLTAEYPSQQCSDASLIVNMGIPFCKVERCDVFIQ